MSATDAHRRAIEDMRASKALEHRALDAGGWELRGGTGDGQPITFAGYASLFGIAYPVGRFVETIRRGAFKRTLSEAPDVVFRLEHSGLPLARTKRPGSDVPGTLTLAEDERGLKVDARFDPDDPDAQTLRRKMHAGLVSEMSFAFRCNDDDWNADMTERTVKSVTLNGGDVSAVTFGASPQTGSTTSIRSAEMEWRARYAAHEMAEMGAKGEAFANPDGHWSFPIGDEDDLRKAILAVGRSGASHNKVRLYIMRRAKALGLFRLIPINWGTDGSARSRLHLPDYTTRAAQELEVLRAGSTVRAIETQMEECPECKGTGVLKVGNLQACPTCEGSGKIPRARRGADKSSRELAEVARLRAG
jgi:HK97 family phage prohead protease